MREEAEIRGQPLRNVVLHRDGRVWPSEISGAQEALKLLKNERIVGEDASITILEISKSAPARLRLYALLKSHQGRNLWIENPEIGTFYIPGAEAFLCSTGRAFPRPGTNTGRNLHLAELLPDISTSEFGMRPSRGKSFPLALARSLSRTCASVAGIDE